MFAQGPFRRHARYLWMIILLRKMRQDEELCPSIIVGCEEIRERVIGQMSDGAHHPLLHAPRIRAAAQQFEVVVGFDHQHMAAAQIITNVSGM